jgi:peptide chain release factor 2
VRRKWSAFSACGGTFDEDSLKEQLAEVDAEAQDPDIWSDQDRARQVMSRRSQLQQQISTAESLIEAHEELEVLMEMAREGEEGADAELGSALKRISPLLDRVELTAKMTGESSKSTPAPAAPKARIGRRCSSGSTCDGPSGAVSTSR